MINLQDIRYVRLATRNVAAATQNQALSALLFLYGKVLQVEIGWLDDMVRAKRPVRLPVVLSPGETQALLAWDRTIDSGGMQGMARRALVRLGLHGLLQRLVEEPDGNGQQHGMTVEPLPERLALEGFGPAPVIGAEGLPKSAELRVL